MLQFASLNLSSSILQALTEEGYTTPTPIQAKAIPAILEGRDMLGCAQTGTGKTAAFALPILHRLQAQPADTNRRGPVLPRVLVLSPTRELATQIGESFAAYGRHTGLTHTTVFGGVSQFHQVRAMHKGVDVLVATPGRLIDLMEQRVVNLSAVKIFVLDEADRMLDMGFINPIRRIASALAREGRQTLLFSATMPKEIMHLADSLLRDPARVAVTPVASAAPLIEQSVYLVGRELKTPLLQHLLREKGVARALVFTRTKHGADKLMKKLRQSGINSEAIHGNKAQNQRQRALDAFRSGRSRVLVATDVAARGLDVDGITHVFNYDIPVDPESYVHRIGRTGRAGATGIAISFCDGEERSLMRDIERLTGKRFTPITQLPELPKPEPRVESFQTERAPQAPQSERGEIPYRGERGHQRGGRPPSRVPAKGHANGSGHHAERGLQNHHHSGQHEPSPSRPVAKQAGPYGGGFNGASRPQGAHAARRLRPERPQFGGGRRP